jgi:hypothetical protein
MAFGGTNAIWRGLRTISITFAELYNMHYQLGTYPIYNVGLSDISERGRTKPF